LESFLFSLFHQMMGGYRERYDFAKAPSYIPHSSSVN
jgi:hypothetical protein